MFKQGNEHLFKEIRRKIAPCANGSADKDPAARVPPDGSGGDGQAMQQLQSGFDELRHKHTQMEAKLHDKDSEQRYLVARMLQDQEEHQALESRVSTMMRILNQACLCWTWPCWVQAERPIALSRARAPSLCSCQP